MNASALPAVNVDPAKIVRTYSGAAGRCCCGCCGKYSETDRSKKIIANKINAAIASGIRPMVDSEFVSVDVGGRTLTAYFS